MEEDGEGQKDKEGAGHAWVKAATRTGKIHRRSMISTGDGSKNKVDD